MPIRRRIPELDDVEWLTARREEGWSVRRIATTVRVDPGRVRKALRDAGLPPRLEPIRHDVPELDDAVWLTERRHDGWSVRRIAGHLHVDDKRVRSALRDARLSAALPPTQRTFPKLHDIEWMRRQLRTRTMADIARELGCSQRSVRDAARRAGRTPGPPPPHRPALLDDAEWLRRELATRSAADVARELGCSPSTVLSSARRHDAASPSQGHRPRFPELHDADWLAANIYVGTPVDIADQLGCSIASVKAARSRYRALLAQPR